MYAFELLARLQLLTLCGQDEDGELEFVGTARQWFALTQTEVNIINAWKVNKTF